MTRTQVRLAPLTVLVLAAVAAVLVLPRPAWAINPCDEDNPPDYCFEQHTETQAETLTVTRTAGTITSSPAGISCGTSCSMTVDATRSCDYYDCSAWSYPSVTLAASGGPAGDSPSWGGACTGTASTCSVTLTAARSVSLAWLDVTDPSISISAPAKSGRTLSVSAGASDNAGVAGVSFYIDGILKATDTTAPYSAALDMSGYAQASTHTVTARATDTSGRIATASQQLTVDKLVNLTLGTLPAYTNASAVPLAIATDPDAAMSCRLDAGAATPCAGTFSPIGATTPDGTHTYAVTATDAVGNVVTGKRTLVLDRTAPAITAFDGPAEGQQVASKSIAFTFAVADANLAGVSCALDARAPQPCSGKVTLSGLTPGTHRFMLSATDRAGNAVTKTRTFVVAAVSRPSAPAPAAPRPSLDAVHLAYTFIRARGWTKFTSLKLRAVPARAKVKVTCHGKGCPRKPSLKRVRGRKLRPGARIAIRVTLAGAKPKTIALAVRRGRSPKVT